MKKREKTLAISMFILIGILISGCGSGQILEPTSTPTPTITPNPTFTPSPTNTPSPTFTPTPTIEPPAELTTLFEEVYFTYYEDFDTLPVNQWDDYKNCLEFKNGVLESKCIDYNGEISLHGGEGILLEFYYDNVDDYYWEIILASGSPGPQSDDFKFFGFQSNNFSGQMLSYRDQSSKDYHDSFVTNWTKPDTWYRLALAIGEDGSTSLSVWERDNPDPQIKTYTKTKIEGWDDSEWRFYVASKGATVVLDNYYQFTFTNMKE